MFHTKVVEKIKTKIICSTNVLECRAVYETMCEKMVDPEMPQTNR
jgi:hypothetical protein